MSRARKALAAALLALVALTAAGSAAGAVRIKQVDLASYPSVRVTVLTSRDTSPPTLLENGHAAPYLDAARLRSKSVVVAVDRSRSMNGGVLAAATDAARTFVKAKPAADRVALFSFASKPLQLTSFATDTIDVDSALRSLSVDGGQGTRLYDSVVLASLALQHLPKPRILILLTDGRDFGSAASLDDAVAAAKSAGVSVYSIGMAGTQLTPAPLRSLARATGGSYYPAGRTRAFLTQAYGRVAAELRRTWTLEYLTAKRPGDPLHLVAKAGPAGTAKASVRIPTDGASPVKGDSWLDTLRSHWWGALLIGLLAALVLLALLRLAFGTSRKVWLRERLEPWDGDAADSSAPERKAGLEKLEPLLAATESRFAGTGFWSKLERVLERSDSSLTAAQLFYLSLGLGLALAALAALLGASFLLVLAVLVLGALAPYWFYAHRATKRRRAFENQLPAALNTIAGSLKAGHSFRQAMQTIVDEGGAPIDVEFNRVLTEARLGRPIEDALAEMGRRVGSEELDFVLRAVVVQQQVGGSLAGLFELVAETLTQRQQFRQKVKALTAQGRMSAMILICLPFAVAILISLVSPGYLDPLFHSGTGEFLIVLGLVMMTIGSLFLRKITSLKGYR
ncbi:MAG TPA: type II secretion system F family protein [Gaiellaceae bacterium]|jgi:tight adherence protein B